MDILIQSRSTYLMWVFTNMYLSWLSLENLKQLVKYVEKNGSHIRILRMKNEYYANIKILLRAGKYLTNRNKTYGLVAQRIIHKRD